MFSRVVLKIQRSGEQFIFPCIFYKKKSKPLSLIKENLNKQKYMT
jgi:hypothetical protein